MFKVMGAALLAGLFAGPLLADDKPAEAKSREAQLQELQKDLQKAMQEIVPEWRKATTDEERNKALAKIDPFLERGLKIVAENPKDDFAFNTLMFLTQVKPEPPAQVLDAIVEHHFDNPKIVSVVTQMTSTPSPANEKRLRTILEKTKIPEVKGAYFLGTAQATFQKAETTKNEKEKSRLMADAEKLFERVNDEFGSLKMGRMALGTQAKRFLFEIRKLGVGMPAPEVVSKDLEDKETKLSALKGKVVVLDIWATWCGPCRAMIPHEREMVEKLKDKPFALISISADDDKGTLEEFLKKEKMPWTHWWEGVKETGIIMDWNVRFYPTIYVLDHKGVIRFKNVRGKELEESVEKLLADQEKEKKP